MRFAVVGFKVSGLRRCRLFKASGMSVHGSACKTLTERTPNDVSAHVCSLGVSGKPKRYAELSRTG